MKITCFISSLYVGGAEHQLSILAGLLANKGYDVDFVTYTDLPDIYSLNKRVNRIRLISSKYGIIKQFQIFWFLLWHKMDCLISYRERMNFLSLPPMFLRPKVKVIVGERNLTVGAPTMFGRINLKYLYHRANYIVPNSYAQTEYIANRCPEYKRKGKLKTIINYTEIENYKASVLPCGTTLEIGVFCRYSKQKNYERFAETVKILKMKGYDFHASWYGMIQTPDGICPDYLAFKSIVEKEHIDDMISLNEQVKDVVSLMPRFDIIALPSIYEGFSNSLSEAISCGKPVLAGNVSDNKLMVIDGENGFLFDPYNVNDMVSAFEKMLLTTPEQRSLFSINSRKIAERLFDEDRFVNEYINLIES